MSQDAFKKFTNPKKNSVVKEEYRQEKKKARADKNAYFDNLKEEKYQAMLTKRAIRDGKPLPVSAKKEAEKKEAAQKTPGTSPKKVNSPKTETNTSASFAEMPLNKFLAHCGVCSRREAVTHITAGNVKVNEEIVKEPGFKITPADKVYYNGKQLFVTKNLIYILLNKPKDFITTTDDPQGRKTVLQLIKHATEQRVYPIGRLDRNTSGVLLLTNDGDLTQKLSHPSYQIKKIYEVRLDKNLTKADFESILGGLTLEDGLVQVDSLAYADDKDKSIIGIEIHSGRNRIVRRIFEHLGYDVKALDRVMYAGLTKKNVERSKWRYLSDKEIRLLKYMNESKNKNSKDNTAVLEELDAQRESRIAKPAKKFTAPKTDKAKETATDKPKESATDKPAKREFVKTASTKPAGKRKFKTHSEKKKHQLNSGKK